MTAAMDLPGVRRLWHVTDFLPGHHAIAGGAEHAVARILEQQRRMGWPIEVFTTRPTAGDGPWAPMALPTVGGRFRGLRFLLKQLFLPVDPLAVGAFRRHLRERPPDLVHCHNLHFLSPALFAACHAQGVPVVASIYDYWYFCPNFMLYTADGDLCRRGHGRHCAGCTGGRLPASVRPLLAPLFGRRPRWFGRYLAQVDRFVVLSPASAALLRRHGIAADRVRVIPQYPWRQVEDNTVPSAGDRGRLVYAGWMERRKGLHVLVDALGRLAPHHPEIHLHVLGLAIDPAYEDGIQGQVRACGLEGRVHFHGRLDRAAFQEELRRAFLVAIPEQWENMSPVILVEAMTMGRCVLASRTGGIQDIVTHGVDGLLAERNDPESWASAIQWAMAHPERLPEMGRAARKRAATFHDPAEINRRYRDLYLELTGFPP